MAGETSTAHAAMETAVQSSTALYVGDLDSAVTEEELSRLFQVKGDVTSVKICRDQTTERSLGYGARALEELNFTPLNGKCIRLSYSNRDASLRGSNAGNIFVKNLDKTVDHKALHNMFSSFGNIISSKVKTDSFGHSKGYGYVQYNSEEAARKAIEQLNGVMFHGKELYVGPFIRKQEREMPLDKKKYTNVFLKNLSEHTTEDDLKTIFSEFGLTNSVAVMRDEDGKSKCFGFVNFENAEDAAKSVEVLNGRVFDGKKWYVARAQKKSEREQELKQLAKEAHERSLGLNNLSVKNLDDDIDDDKLKELFSFFGTIVSSKVLYDPRGLSKGSGFVAFSSSQEASRARSEMNGKMVGSKPLYVAIAERKEDRKERLQVLFSSMLPHTILPTMAPHMPMYPPAGPGLGQQMFSGRAPPAIIPPTLGFGHHQQFVTGIRPSQTVLPNIIFPLIQHGPQGENPQGRRARGIDEQQSQMPVPMMHQMLSSANAYYIPPGNVLPNVLVEGTRGGTRFATSEIPRLPVNDSRILRSMSVGALASALVNASSVDQRTILGENLYPLVEDIEQDMAVKVTGMLLEMDQTEVLHLLESPQSLTAKVAEAVEILRNASHQQSMTSAVQLAPATLSHE